MFDRSFQDMGIPAGYAFKKLLFSPTASVIVVQAQSAGENWRPERLYLRSTTENQYSQVGTPGDLISQESPTIHKALLAYNLMQHSFSIDDKGKERHSGDWDSLRVFSLKARLEVQEITPKTLPIPEGFERAWISGILGFGESEDDLYVTAGLSRDGMRMEYHLSKLNFVRRKLHPLSLLPAVFM